VRVEVQLFATLVSFLPPDSRNGATTLDMPEGSTVRDVARRLGIPGDFDRVSLVNGQAAELERALHPGDVVTVFPPLMGGRPGS
jgi:sulfur-carrier protein